MKKLLLALCIPAAGVLLAMPVCAAGIDDAALSSMKYALMAMLALLVLLTAACTGLLISYIAAAIHHKRPPASTGKNVITLATVVTTGIVALAFVFCWVRYRSLTPSGETGPDPLPSQASQTAPSTAIPTTGETVPPTTIDPRVYFQAARTEDNDPANYDITWKISVDGEVVESFIREEPISFGDGSDYFALPGIATFRGNNYRNSSTYGTANVTQAKLTQIWKNDLGWFNDWGGSGWTGQPLVVCWDHETKQNMNLYEDKKAKMGLVEVIYATLDGNIYFYDLEDGSYTRDPIWMGHNFKGAGALDPRGYPVMYVGSGLYVGSKSPRMFAVSLIDGSILFELGYSEPFALRRWNAFDSSPLVDAETDTLIWPGENGILYTIKLNSQYDKTAGTLTMDPGTIVRTRYTTNNSSRRYLGYENSVSIVDRWLYTAENGGKFFCVDLNTMELVWAQDTKDDNNSSPAFEWDDQGNGYLYTAPSLHWTAKNSKGAVSIYKLNAANGDIVWEYPVDCTTVSGSSGGVQSTPLLGKAGTDIEDLIIYTVARVPNTAKGIIIALDRQTGNLVWQHSTEGYSWSSPTAVYTNDGKGYIVYGNVEGDLRLLDGATGETLDTINLGSTIECSPLVFGDMIVVGTRSANVFGIRVD